MSSVPATWNVFRLLADISHTVSKCILIWAIHWNRSSEGVSFLTQLMYIVVFLARYLDLFWVAPQASIWNFTLKIFYISTSFYIIFLMLRVFKRTMEKEKSWKMSAYITGGCVLAAPFMVLIFNGTKAFRPFELLWTFSIILEAFCILPQLILLRQTAVPTVIDSYYLVTLGSYRGFYILNWIYRAAKNEHINTVKVIFGVIQTAFYLDFAWVYYSRQRVKLRGGGIVDSDDLRKGFLVNRFVNRRQSAEDEEGGARPEEAGDDTTAAPTVRPKTINRWGNRGISISADDTLDDADTRKKQNHERAGARATEASQNANGEDRAFLSEEDDDAPVLDTTTLDAPSSGAEWRA